jgi:hypothetical protein
MIATERFLFEIIRPVDNREGLNRRQDVEQVAKSNFGLDRVDLPQPYDVATGRDILRRFWGTGFGGVRVCQSQTGSK